MVQPGRECRSWKKSTVPDFDRALYDFLNLHANRLRRWMEQSIKAMRNAFAATADMQRAEFSRALPDDADKLASITSDLRLLRDWETIRTDSKARRPPIFRLVACSRTLRNLRDLLSNFYFSSAFRSFRLIQFLYNGIRIDIRK